MKPLGGRGGIYLDAEDVNEAIYIYEITMPLVTLYRSPVFSIVTFEQGVDWLTGSYSMAVRPIEEHPRGLKENGTLIKYATRGLRALLQAKPSILPLSAKNEVKCHTLWI